MLEGMFKRIKFTNHDVMDTLILMTLKQFT